MTRVTVPEGQTPLDDKLGHRLLDVFREGQEARKKGTGSPYHGHSLEHCIHAAGWVQQDLRMALDMAQKATVENYREPGELGEGATVRRSEPPTMSWQEYYMGFALHAAKKSKDSTQVGAVLVGPDGEIRLSGYNGPPRGVADLPERRERPTKYLFASHAEANLVAFAAREGIRTKGCTVYVSHHPCSSCSRSLIQAGIVCVVVGPGKTSMSAEEFEAAAVMFDEAGVKTMLLSEGAMDE